LGLTLPNYGKASFSDDGSLIYQHFKDGEIYCLKSSSGQIVWSKTFFPMAGWTYLNGDLYGGILAEQGGFGISPGIYHLDASTGSYVDRWRAPHQCFASGQTSFLAPGQQDNTAPSNTAATEVPNCNNIWTNSVAYGDYLYFMDDYFGLMKLDAFDISSGPVWTNAFAQNAPQGSQQTFYPPIVSRDGSIVYASALHSTAAVLAETGETLWVVSQDNQWITRTMLLGGNDELYLPYNFSIHKIVDGETEWRTDSTLLNTFMTLDPSGSTVFAAGVTVQAYRVDLPPLTVPEETLEQNSTASTTTSLGDTSSCPIRRLDFLATLLSLVYVTLC
jgi:outer membrane protein assembly factor BamB